MATEDSERLMIPDLISKKSIESALSSILRDGVPSRRRGRDYCVVADGEHFPPKYAIALAHRIATGEFLNSDKFSGERSPMTFSGAVASMSSRAVAAALVMITAPPQ